MKMKVILKTIVELYEENRILRMKVEEAKEEMYEEIRDREETIDTYESTNEELAVALKQVEETLVESLATADVLRAERDEWKESAEIQTKTIQKNKVKFIDSNETILELTVRVHELTDINNIQAKELARIQEKLADREELVHEAMKAQALKHKEAIEKQAEGYQAQIKDLKAEIVEMASQYNALYSLESGDKGA